MKTGKTITQLAQELVDIQEKKVDLIVPSNKISMNTFGDLFLQGDDLPSNLPVTMVPTKWADSQISTYTNIPKAYYDRIRLESTNILCQIVNHGFQQMVQRAHFEGKQESRMVRLVDNNIRGFLSSRYRRLDSADLLEAVLPILTENQFNVVSCELTDRRMYLKVTTDKIKGEVKKGMVVQYGLVISSSDVGCGSVRVEPLMYECICDNGQICQTAMRKFHVGKDQATQHIEQLLSDKTKELDDEVFWRKVQDLVKGSMEVVNFEKELNLLKEADQVSIENFQLEKVIDLTMKEVGVTGEKKKGKILEYLASGADGRGLTKYGLANSFTWAAHQTEGIDYEEATELERAGGKIIVMPKSAWKKVAC